MVAAVAVVAAAMITIRSGKGVCVNVGTVFLAALSSHQRVCIFVEQMTARVLSR